MGWRSKRWSHRGDDLGDLGDLFAKLWPHKMMLESSRYDKWDRGGGGGGGGGGGSGGAAPSGPWPGRDRERDRERERQARAHQMSHAHAPEPDASSLFPAPFRVTGNRDRVSQQIQTKLGDYHLAQCFIDDPSKSIGICAEPPSPAPCPPSRRESEFKKPSHAPQNGRVHHRPYYNKSEGPSSTGAPAHRPPPLRIPNGVPTQTSIDSSQPPIESILKEMKSLPTPLSVIAATPRKELENKFIFNPYTNKVQENPQLTNNDLKTTLPKPGLDNRISNSRSSVSPDVVNKDLGLSESDDDVAANAHRLGPPISPIGSGSPSSSSSQSDSESESSSAGSAPATPAPAAAAVTAPQQTQQTQRSSWSLSNFAPPPAQPTDPTYDSGKELTHALAVAKGKPQSPVSEMSDSEASCGSPGARRRPAARRSPSTASSDDEAPRHHNTTSPRVLPSVTAPPLKRGRPPKAGKCEERPPKKRRGRPRKAQPPSPPPAPPAPPDSDNEPDPPTHHHTQQETKTHIFRKVFTARKVDEGGGKGGKGGKGKGGKGKGQVTIEITAPESVDDEDRRLRERSAERRQEAMARVSPPVPRPHAPHGGYGPSPHGSRDADRRRSADRIDRPPDRLSTDRIQTERTSNDRIPTAIGRSPSKDRIATERTSNDRISDRVTERVSHDRLPDRTMSDRLSDRLSSERLAEKVAHDRLAAERIAHERLTAEKLAHERLAAEKLVHERLAAEKLAHERLEPKMNSRLPDKMVLDRLADTKASLDRLGESKTSIDRLADNKMSIDRLGESKVSIDRLAENKMSIDRLGENKLSIERVAENKLALERGKDGKEAKLERFVRAEADVGSGLKPGRGSERLEDPSSNVLERRRMRLLVKVPLCRLRPQTVAALQHSPLRRQPPKQAHTPHAQQAGEVAATNHERTAACGQTPIYYSYFERLPADAHSDDERDHKFYLEEAKRLRLAGEGEQEPLARVMLYLESVLCFVLTGRVLELELDTKRAFTVYRETIEYINSIDSMPQCFRVEPHSTFNKLDILSLRVRALLYLRMFKMYNRDVKEYSKIVQDYQQKPACAESVSSVSPLSPTPSPAGSVGSVGSGASSGYCSLHAVPAHAHQALLQLTKYYSFLHVAHDLWEQADGLCRHRAYRDLFIAVDRKCGPLSLSSTFRHLVQYVRHAISLLKNAPAE